MILNKCLILSISRRTHLCVPVRIDSHHPKPNTRRSTASSFARQIYPSNFTPSPCHRFIKLVENNGQLLRNYTQNIDTLETAVGVRNVLQCHGSFATASCLECRIRVPGNVIEQEIMQGEVPLCKNCVDSGNGSRKAPKSVPKRRRKLDSDDEEDDPLFPPWVMKPDITFFGEKLTDSFEKCLEEDREQADLLLIIGTSLKVAPVSDIITHMPHSVPQVRVPLHLTGVFFLFDDVRFTLDSDQQNTSDSCQSRYYTSGRRGQHYRTSL
jgi:NAD-dependent SIR2 family protein deacetylase